VGPPSNEPCSLRPFPRCEPTEIVKPSKLTVSQPVAGDRTQYEQLGSRRDGTGDARHREFAVVSIPMKPRRLLLGLAADKLGSPKWRDPWWLGPVLCMTVLAAVWALAFWLYW
jgi:hypothetical protein